MDTQLYIVPIKNFMIESVFKLGDVYFSPPYTQEEVSDLSYTDLISKLEFEQIQKYIEVFYQSKQIDLTNVTIAITHFKSFTYRNFEDSFMLVDKVCEEVDRKLDYFRLTNCQIGNFNTLPGLPGFLPDGFKTIYKWDKNLNNFITVPGEVTLMFQKGIGLMPSQEPSKQNSNEIVWKCLFSERTDEVFLNCRAALIRINEAMYMNNLNTAFIYLMTTMEMLADKDTMLTYKKIKPRILPFIANDTKHYHVLSEYIRELSELKRTEIVHNGKNIYELYIDKSMVIKELFKVTGIITKYIEKVISMEIYTFDELENKRTELKKHLKV